MSDMRKWTGHLLTFPFWIACTDANQWSTLGITTNEGAHIRIYRPFRSAPANWIPMPEISVEQVPAHPSAMQQLPSQSPFIHNAAYSLPETEAVGIDTLKKIRVFSKETFPNNMKIMPMDSIRADFAHPDPAPPPHVLRNFLELLVSHVRLLTNQWWINQSMHSLIGYERGTFATDGQGSYLGTPSTLGSVRTIYGFETALTQEDWQVALSYAKQNAIPALHKQALLDSYYFLSISDTNRAIFESAIALEAARDEAAFFIWREDQRRIRSKQKYKHGRIFKGTDLPRHISIDFYDWQQTSFAHANPEAHDKIGYLWEARGNIAHGKPFHIVRNGARHSFSEQEVEQFVHAARAAIDWLQGEKERVLAKR